MEDALKLMARNWWILLVRGLAAILFGITAIVWPALSLSVMVMLFGAYILVDGVFSMFDAIRARNSVDNWWLWLLEGLLGVAMGLLTLFMPGITALLLLAFVAVWSILGGVLRIATAIQLRKKIQGEWVLIFSGVLSILFGIAIVALPHAGLVSIAWLIGFWAIVFGVVFVLLAFRLRKAVK